MSTKSAKKPNGAVAKSEEQRLVEEGYLILPAGVDRTIGVNQDWLKDYDDRPWKIATADGAEVFATEVVTLGTVSTIASRTVEGAGCGKTVNVKARIVTSGPVAYKA